MPNTDPLTPTGRISQVRHAKQAMRKLHEDPVWHAAWLAKTRAHHIRRKKLVDKALALLKSTESPTT